MIMDFQEAISIINDCLPQTVDKEYDGILVKIMRPSNTLDAGRTTNQTHIAITGPQMDMFPCLKAPGYFECRYDDRDGDLKKYFVFQVPFYIYKSNYEELGGTADDLFFVNNEERCQSLVSIFRSRRTNDIQLQILLKSLDDRLFISFRELLHENDILILLKLKGELKYDCFGLKQSQIGDSQIMELAGQFIKQAKTTRVRADNYIVVEEDESERKDYSVEELGQILSQMYRSAEADNGKKKSIHMFTIKYGAIILEKGYSAKAIIAAAPGLKKSFETEVNSALNIFKSISNNEYGIKFYDGEHSTSEHKIKKEYTEPVYNTKFRCDSRFLNRIVFGAPGTGKSKLIKDDCEKTIKARGGSFERVTFHPDYTYSQFVGTYKPVTDDDGNIMYSFVPGPFMRVFVEAIASGKTQNPEPHILIVEEINRAKVAAVFGDVFQLLDRNDDGESYYKIQPSEDVKKYLADKLGGVPENYKSIKLPNNMLIWASMNSADQGVYPMDTAFKRRWSFEYLGIDDKEDMISSKGKILLPNCSEPMSWNNIRKAINAKMLSDDYRVNEDKLLGPFFLSGKDIESDKDGNIIDTKRFYCSFESKVIMYLYEDAVRHGKHNFFKGCDNSKYSSVCEAFRKTGLDIFGNDFIEKFYKE